MLMKFMLLCYALIIFFYRLSRIIKSEKGTFAINQNVINISFNFQCKKKRGRDDYYYILN